ncbi:Protein of unknown function [Pyronema omphalodes CBS 100304]|uniref:Uncharacterized protein n=1 Tax=Pyronema omphalodes (strain CBS 100304) TaxID=1076935 RepID=U4LR65_PYROM|nr:Protein of unknown function [Pyronema omphalodes CBS 100304]
MFSSFCTGWYEVWGKSREGNKEEDKEVYEGKEKVKERKKEKPQAKLKENPKLKPKKKPIPESKPNPKNKKKARDKVRDNSQPSHYAVEVDGCNFWLDGSSEQRRQRKDTGGFVGLYRDRNEKNSESWRSFMIEMAIEPAFENEGVRCRDSVAIES